MGAHGFRVAEHGHFVPLFTSPVSGTAVTDIFSMGEHSHASIILRLGSVVNTALVATLKRSDDFSSTNTTAIDFKYYVYASGTDVHTGINSSASSLTIASGSTSKTYIIEVDAQEMSADAKNLVLDFNGSLNSVVDCHAILSGSRYAEDQRPTVLS